jgi:hypothetical protein
VNVQRFLSSLLEVFSLSPIYLYLNMINRSPGRLPYFCKMGVMIMAMNVGITEQFEICSLGG